MLGVVPKILIFPALSHGAFVSRIHFPQGFQPSLRICSVFGLGFQNLE